MRSVRSTLPLFALLAGLVAAGCDGPTAPTEDAFEPPAPAFLLGGSPLIILINDPALPIIDVTAEVTRGLTIPKPNDVFKLRTSLSFAPCEACGVTSQVFGVSQQKDEGLRGSGTVAIIMCINIPIDVWTKLQAADTQSGNPTATATVELVLVDGNGKEHILDTKTKTDPIDPLGDG